MGSFSIWHWIVVLLVVVLIFGAGKLPNVMGDVAKGIKSFKRNLNDEDVEDTKHVTDDNHTKEPPRRDPT
jgi:sec-independent protein translocase protein TatA